MLNPVKLIKAIYSAWKNPPEPNWYVKKRAKKTKAHPLAGFWKINKKHNHGLAIGPAGKNLYYISFCGPSGCFKENTYRPNTSIVNDESYEVINENTIEVHSKKGSNTYERC